MPNLHVFTLLHIFGLSSYLTWCGRALVCSLFSNASRSVATEEDGEGGGSQRGRQDGPDFTDDGEVGVDERSSGAGGGVGQYLIRYEKDGGEMARVLERQAELIGQYEEEENAQREWEKQYNEHRNANKVSNWKIHFCTGWYPIALGCYCIKASNLSFLMNTAECSILSETSLCCNCLELGI
jgi:hypothetical protein